MEMEHLWWFVGFGVFVVAVVLCALFSEPKRRKRRKRKKKAAPAPESNPPVAPQFAPPVLKPPISETPRTVQPKSNALEKWEDTLNTLWQGRLDVQYEYTNRSGVITARRVTISKLSISDTGEEYLTGFCSLREDTRHFKLSRINGSIQIPDLAWSIHPADLAPLLVNKKKPADTNVPTPNTEDWEMDILGTLESLLGEELRETVSYTREPEYGVFHQPEHPEIWFMRLRCQERDGSRRLFWIQPFSRRSFLLWEGDPYPEEDKRLFFAVVERYCI
jgi:hypothetical protein